MYHFVHSVHFDALITDDERCGFLYFRIGFQQEFPEGIIDSAFDSSFIVPVVAPNHVETVHILTVMIEGAFMLYPEGGQGKTYESHRQAQYADGGL